jgi:hypothetical protein
MFCEATLTQTLPDLVACKIRALEYFGAVPEIRCPTNFARDPRSGPLGPRHQSHILELCAALRADGDSSAARQAKGQTKGGNGCADRPTLDLGALEKPRVGFTVDDCSHDEAAGLRRN